MPAPRILAIEVSNPSSWTADQPIRPGVAIGVPGAAGVEVVGIEPVDPERAHDTGLMPAIDRLMTRCGLQPRDLRSVAVSIGPGGYTGVRIAVTTGMLIAEATGAECVPVHSADVAARRVDLRGVNLTASWRFAVAIGSKDQSTYLTVFGPDGRPCGDGRLAAAGDLDDSLGLLVADRFLPEAMRERARELGIRIQPPIFDPAACLEAAMDACPVDPALLAPLYPREPEAVTKWRELKRRGSAGG